MSRCRPAALIINGVVPRGEETKWLSTMLLHPSCQDACLIMLSEELEEAKHQRYMQLGATDHLIKPVSSEQLQTLILTVMGHIDGHQKH